MGKALYLNSKNCKSIYCIFHFFHFFRSYKNVLKRILKQINIFDFKLKDVLNLLKEEKDRKLLEEIIEKTNNLIRGLSDDWNGLFLSSKIKECGQTPKNTQSGRFIQLAQCMNGLCPLGLSKFIFKTNSCK